MLALQATIERGSDRTDPVVLRFSTGIEEYRGYLPRHIHNGANILLIDGQILEHGLPKGAKVLEYEFGRHSDKLSSFATKKVRTIAQTSQVVRRDRSGVPKEHALYEREVLQGKTQTHAELSRMLLLLPHGSVSLAFRIRPHTLKRQYVSIHSGTNGVTLRSVVH